MAITGSLAIFIVLCSGLAQARQKSTELTIVNQLIKDFLALEDRLWLQLNDNENKFESAKETSPEVEIIIRIREFGDELEKEFPHELSYGLEILRSSGVWQKVYGQMRSIYAMYETFRRFQNQNAPGRIPSPKEAWIQFTDTVLRVIPQALENVEALEKSENLFLKALKIMDNKAICHWKQSPRQLLYNLYETIAVSQLKAYILVQFSNMVRNIYGTSNNTSDPDTREDFKKRIITTSDLAKNAMSKTFGDLWRCDPVRHIPGETYLEITQLLQGYVQNEVDLNSDGTCRENCAAYTYTKSHSCYQNLYCRQQRRCNGKIINCRYIDSDMYICPSNSTLNRRYEYIEYENGRVFGRKQSCPKGRIQVDSWWRWLFWHCSYCMCLCDEEGIYSDRYISMRGATSNIKQNRVVTGIRFVKENRIIHLQVQEGELLPRGVINQDTVQWKPIDSFTKDDPYVYRNQDYFILSWETRSVDLDDLTADEADQVVTGVRFKKIGSHLNFEILLTPFDFTTGKLRDTLSFWKDNLNTEFTEGADKRTRVPLDRTDIPTRALTPTKIDSKTNQYIEFTHTDFDKDAAQTTVPFFDGQPVDSELSVPLHGAGIYHKGQSGFGGFLGLKVITYDYSSHLMKASDVEEDAPVN